MRISEVFPWLAMQADRALTVVVALIGGASTKQARQTLDDHDRFNAFRAAHPELCDQAYRDGTELKKLNRHHAAKS